jgi:hypothetical protein
MCNWLARIILAFAIVTWPFPDSSFADDSALPIVKLAFRDHIVTISSTAQGLRYSVRTSSGALLSENLTEQELLAAHPQLHSHIRSGYANDAPGSYIWAGSDEFSTEQPEDLNIGGE